MPPPDPPDANQNFQFPGVYIEEISSGQKAIAGVNTSTAAFVGVTLSGPVGAVPTLLTSFSDFQEVYGDTSDITLSGPTPQTIHNYLALAVRAFFENGGHSLYVARVAARDGGNAALPTTADYAEALTTLEGLTDVSIVAAPGATIAGGGTASVAPIHAALIAHVSRPGAYQIAVLDPPPSCSISDIQALRGLVDSKNGALYYPWVTIANPQKPLSSINVPPSGFICGICARVDSKRGVWKAPANEPLVGATGFERTLTTADTELLNPLGVNCLRAFPGKGNLVWGARTTSSGPEWKYVNLRRYFLYLEQSIDQGTQWVVFEPNGDLLWATVRRVISDFLHNEWRKGALMGSKPEEAYFVKCDRTTMTQNDLDNGRLICVIGIAAVKPAEFVIFRIGQWTADGKPPDS
jgi:phage tail sheath protein FI